jgi:ubiquinone/menaquinone biosynthesis C-methylase UbiE
MTTAPSPEAPKSAVLHSTARYYDVLTWMMTLGREGAVRERIVEIARVAPGEAVLDVGCGTGTLALAAKRRVGPTGKVRGVDASPDMLARARRKAAKAQLDVGFDVAGAESLPFSDASLDVVLATLMLHHLPAVTRERFASEVHRVLRPGGRVLAVDFEPPAHGRGGPIVELHRHGHVPLREIIELLGRAGLRVEESGDVGAADLRFALAVAPTLGDGARDDAAPRHRSLPPLPTPRWMLPALLASVVAFVHALMWRHRRRR